MSIQTLLNNAVRAYRNGDFQAAIGAAEGALRSAPDSPGAHQLLGVFHCQAGNLRVGADHIRRAIAAGADTFDNRFNLARALIQIGEYDEAQALCLRDQNVPEMQRLFAELQKTRGQIWEAASSYERLVAANPRDHEAWNNLGSVRLESGDYAGALAAFQQSLDLQPGNPAVYVNVGRTLAAADRHNDSLVAFQEAVKADPKNPELLLELGRALHRTGHSREALLPLGTAARLDPKNGEIFVAMGLALAAVPDLPQAERAFRAGLHFAPGSAAGYLNLGIILEQANRIDELETLIGLAEANGSTGGELTYLRALLARRRGDIQEALSLAQSAWSPEIDPTFRAQLIGQLADQLGDTNTAFAAFAEMNEATASQPAAIWNGSEHRFYVEDLICSTTPEWFEKWHASPPAPLNQAPPAFLIGFVRSGTTLLDTVLMGHSRLHVLEEEPLLAKVEEQGGAMDTMAAWGADEIRTLRDLYLDAAAKVAPIPPGSIVIDKNPLATLRVPLIHRLFPDAPIIFTLRHPCDVVLSAYMQNFKVSQAMSSFLDLRNAALFYDATMRYWERCLEIFPIKVHYARYEAMVTDLEAEARELIDFLGLDWEPGLLDHQRTARERGYIRTPSYAQVTQPIYTHASGRWERYRNHMEPVLDILGPWIDRFGYKAPAS